MSPFLRLSGRIPSSFWFLPLVCKVVPLVCLGFFWGWLLFVLWWKEVSFFFFFLSLMIRTLWGGDPVCWWLGLCFYLVFFFFFWWGILHWVLLEVWQAEAFVGVLTNKYSLGLGVLWQSRVLSVLPLQRLWAWSLAREVRFHRWFVMALKKIKTNTLKEETKCKPQMDVKYKIRQVLRKIMGYIHMHIHTLKKKRKTV